MDNKKLRRVIVVYFLLIPLMWLLTETVWAGLHGVLGGLKIGKALQNPQRSEEIKAFLKQHGLSEKASRKESKEWFEKLTSEEKKEFQELIAKSVDIKNVAGFGSTFSVCVIVFGIIGILSGLLTKVWITAGIFPLISFLLNNPVLRFGVIRNMPLSQKAIIVLGSQFLACYILAYIGATLSVKVATRRQ